ncbi:MAG: hypothetical protein JWP06_873 [Candidatus Saccharibacteria bacterium]|nr:hypothetical protein [Candidatus Saccharibacteria bacterium]
MKKLHVAAIIGLLIITIGTAIWYSAYNQKSNNMHSYDECAAAGYPVLDSFPGKCSMPDGRTFTQTTNDGAIVSLEGLTVCLPHKDMNAPHTMECAMGLKTDDGSYYGLGTDSSDTSLSVVNRRVRVSGTLRPIADSKYQNQETITVTKYEFLD